MENVVQLFPKNKSTLKQARGEPNKVEGTTPASQPPLGADFATVMERNAFNRDRLRREREQANKGVLKSYRIK